MLCDDDDNIVFSVTHCYPHIYLRQTSLLVYEPQNKEENTLKSKNKKSFTFV